jgi:glycosyltransferase involved in cell wall biosynthesis
MKTRVLYVVESFSTGVYAIVRDIACNLDPNSFELRILHSLRSDSPTGYETDLAGDHITLRYIPMGSAREYPKAIKEIRKEIQKFKPDAIHLHSSKAGVLGRIAAKGTSYHHILYSPHGFSFLRTDVSALARRVFLLIEKMMQRYQKATIIAVSEGEHGEAQRITEDVVVINNFINTATFSAIKEARGATVVTTGRIAPQKNPSLFNIIARALPEISFLWVGDGPLREQLDAPNITITGYVPRTEAIQHVVNGLIYLQTSLWEGMPVSILEAMAAKKAIVASNIIGNRDLITHNQSGILCDPHYPEQFIEAIQQLISNKEKREALSEEAFRRVTKYHDVSIAMAAYSQIYRYN